MGLCRSVTNPPLLRFIRGGHLNFHVVRDVAREEAVELQGVNKKVSKCLIAQFLACGYDTDSH